MPFDGNGNYTLPTPSYPAIGGATISSTYRNTIDADLQTALSNCVTRDGQSPALANLPLAGFKLTGLGAGNAAGNSVRYEQVIGLPRARALVASQACADSTLTTVVCGTESFDVGGGYNNVTGKYTAPSTGYYSISCMFQFPLGVDNTEFTCYSYINGVLDVLLEQNFSGIWGSSVTIADQLHLTAGDYVEFKVLQSTGGSKNLAAWCSFACEELG